MRRLLSEVDARGLRAHFLNERIHSDDEAGLKLRAAVSAVSQLQRPRRAVLSAPRAREKALLLADAGVGPVQIARDLRVSRMTVWRWLRGPAHR